MTHLNIARETGPVAGLRQYVATNSKFGEDTPQGRALAELLEAGEGLSRGKAKNAVLIAYCEKFGHEWANSGSTAATVQRKSLRERAAALFANGDDEDEVGVEAEAPATPKRKATPATTASPLTIGDSFTYQGKERVSTWTVIREGVTKKYQRPALICRSDQGREQAWNVKTLAINLRDGKAEQV